MGLAGEPSPAAVRQWEYMQCDANDLDCMNDCGREGWELQTVDAEKVAHFKRPLPRAGDDPPAEG